MEFGEPQHFSFSDEDLIKNYSVVFVRKDHPKIDKYYSVSLKLLIDVIEKQLTKENEEDKKMKTNEDMTLPEYLAQLGRRLQTVENKLDIISPTEQEEGDAWGENVKVKELNCGLEIAMEDYYEIDEDGNKKTEFTFDEALEIEKKTNGEWRVPTIAEWMQIIIELSPDLDRDAFVKTLNLTEDEDGYGLYWSSTVYSGDYAYGLNYGSSVLYPADRYYRSHGWSVRLVKGGENEQL